MEGHLPKNWPVFFKTVKSMAEHHQNKQKTKQKKTPKSKRIEKRAVGCREASDGVTLDWIWIQKVHIYKSVIIETLSLL